MFQITNTLSGSKQSFKSIQPNKVKLYVCGVTPYDQSHIGHGRSYVSFDVLQRWLKFLGYDVSYCRNYTDIDDKLLKKAEEQFRDPLRYTELADLFIKQYQDEMAALNCQAPNYEPRVTEHIPLIIKFIANLIEKGHAYQANGDVYFSIASFDAYGKLSKQQIDQLRAGARVDQNEIKKDPLDFALWKSEKEGTFWKSPWGWGRPGWHIECSALASKYLGDQIDIHGGGRDLIFPHHENEVAQSEARSSKPFANYWIHNGLVRINQEKMSKSLGNILSLAQMFEKYDPMVLRYYFLQHHYHSPMEFSFEDLEGAQKSYKRLCRIFEHAPVGTFTFEQIKQFPILYKMLDFLQDDLNTTGMFGVLFENLDALQKDPEQLSAAKQILHDVLGLRLEPISDKTVAITPEIQQLIDEREKARAEKDFARADQIRDQLAQMGVVIKDKKMK